MNRFFGVVVLFFTTFAFTGCPQPVGTIDSGGGGAGDLEFLWLVPARLIYETEQWYVPKDDLQIMYAGDGKVMEIPWNTPGVSIVIREHAHEVSNPNTIDVNNEARLNTAGRHQIMVTYKGRSRTYTIEVRGTYSGGGDDSDIFDIVWL